MAFLLWLVIAIIIGCSLGVIVMNIVDTIEEKYREEDDFDVEEL